MITRLIVKNYCGIEFLDIPIGPAGVAFRGRCGSGKSSALKAVTAALAGIGIGADAIKIGADQAEILLDMDDISVRRTIKRGSPGDLVVKKDGFTRSAPKAYLTELFGTSTLDPMALLTLKPKERRQHVLKAFPVTVTVDQLRKWGYTKCPDNFDVSGHGLEVVETLRGKAYDQRTGANKIAKEARAEADRLAVLAAEALKNAPESAPNVAAAIAKHDEARGKVAALRARQEESEKAEARLASSREKIEELRVQAEHLRATCPSFFAESVLEAQDEKIADAKSEVIRLEGELRLAKLSVTDREEQLGEMMRQNARAKDASKAAIIKDWTAKDLESTISLATVAPVSSEELSDAVLAECDAAASREATIKADEARADSDRAQAAATAAQAKAQAAEQEAARLSALVKAFTDDAPRELLASCDGIPGLTLEGDDIKLDGKSLDGLCGAEQIQFVVDVAKRANKTKILVVDGLEKLDPDAYDEFVKSATSGGWQLIASRVDRGDIVIEAISAQECAEAAE